MNNHSQTISEFGTPLKWVHYISGTITILALFAPSLSASDQVSVVATEQWSCYFGGQEIVLHYRITSSAAFQGRASWTIKVQDQLIARQEAAVRATPNQSGQLAIQIKLPEVRPGVVIPVSVSISINQKGAHVQRLWIFSKDPFSRDRKMLEELRVTLFDPEKKTSQVFKEWKIPFKLTRNIDALTTIDHGILVIGEGVSFRDYRSLPEVMVKTAARGIPVLCLAPSAGSIPIPGTEKADPHMLARLTLRRSDIIHQFDKRLDAKSWPPDGKIVANSIVLSGDLSGVTGIVSDGDRGWPWFEADFLTQHGKLLICGFGLIEKWDSGPTPRYLMAHLLKYVAGTSNDEMKKNARR